MSEDEGTDCKLTYKEGRRIAEKAEKPYTNAILFALFFYALFAGLIMVFQWLDGIPMHPIAESMSYFVDSGEVSQEFTWYLRKTWDAAILTGGLLGMLSTICLGLTLGNVARKKALKEANEEKP